MQVNIKSDQNKKMRPSVQIERMASLLSEFYSTVTDLARFLGLSTSRPLYNET